MTGTHGSGKPVVYWRTQLPIDYIDTSLVINTWETVSANLSGGKPARIWFITIVQTNNGATAEDIELEITINGTAYTVTTTQNSAGVYYVYKHANLVGGDFYFEATTNVRAVGTGISDFTVPFDAQSVGLIRVRQTTDVDGTSAQIEVNFDWEQLQGV